MIELTRGQVLSEAHQKQHVVFFPTNSIISMQYLTQNGTSGEISVAGNEGMASILVVLCDESSTGRCVAQSNGYAYRLPRQQLKDEFNRSGEFQTLMLRYAQSMMTQVAQSAVCSRHHCINQRLCSWLLQSLDRLQSYHLKITHELIASILGVRREGITEAASRLQRLGVIEYRRGHITVLDRTKLEEHSCECYFVVKKETRRLLPYLKQNETEGGERISAAERSLVQAPRASR